MNEQKPPGGIEWTRLPRQGGTRTRGYTCNPVTGCTHACAWYMADGAVALCYAKVTAEGVARSAYPGGFEVVRFHPERLEEPLSVHEPAGIFFDSMSDLLARDVHADWIEQTLDMCRRADWHTFFLLTKNAPRLAKFVFPPHVWVGASSPPARMHGRDLSRSQQAAMLHRSLRALAHVAVPVRWMSFEPLSWDVSPIVEAHPGVLQWAVIGAASVGSRHLPPDPGVVERLLRVLDTQGVPVFYKGNMRTLPLAAAAWRENFPGLAHV